MTEAPNSTQRTRRRRQGNTTEAVFTINLHNGAEAEHLGLQQAAVIREVLLWHHRNGNGAPSDTNVA